MATVRTADARLRVRQTSDTGQTFTGYGSVFGEVDSYGDVVAAGAFAASLRARAGKIPMLWQHDISRPIGTWLTLREDTRGLWVEGRILDDQVYRLLKGGALDGLSIGFRVVRSETDATTGIRTVTQVDLFEVSLVTFPANEAARVLDVRARSLAQAAHHVRAQRAHVGRLLDQYHLAAAGDRVSRARQHLTDLIHQL